jgi:hypothetical protein
LTVQALLQLFVECRGDPISFLPREQLGARSSLWMHGHLSLSVPSIDANRRHVESLEGSHVEVLWSVHRADCGTGATVDAAEQGGEKHRGRRVILPTAVIVLVPAGTIREN